MPRQHGAPSHDCPSSKAHSQQEEEGLSPTSPWCRGLLSPGDQCRRSIDSSSNNSCSNGRRESSSSSSGGGCTPECCSRVRRVSTCETPPPRYCQQFAGRRTARPWPGCSGRLGAAHKHPCRCSGCSRIQQTPKAGRQSWRQARPTCRCCPCLLSCGGVCLGMRVSLGRRSSAAAAATAGAAAAATAAAGGWFRAAGRAGVD